MFIGFPGLFFGDNIYIFQPKFSNVQNFDFVQFSSMN